MMRSVIMVVEVAASQDIGYNQVHHQAEGRDEEQVKPFTGAGSISL